MKEKLSDFIRSKATELRDPFDQIDDVLNNLSSITKPITEVEKIVTNLNLSYGNSQKISDKLSPIYDWRRAVTEGVEKILNPVLESLEKGKVILDSKTFSETKRNYVTLLEGHLQDLIDLNYKAKAGKKIEARTDAEKEQLRRLNRKLNELASILKLIIDDVVEQILSREMRWIRDGLENILYLHLDMLKTGTQKIAPDLGINFSESALVKVDFIGKASFAFAAGFPVTNGIWDNQVTVKTGTKRDWFTLWLVERDIYETKIEKLESENATIPSIDDLARGWKLQKDCGEVEVFKQVAPWFQKQLVRFNQSVDRFQSDTIDRYQQRLDRAYQESQLDYDEKMKVWQPLQVEAKQFASKLNRLGKI